MRLIYTSDGLVGVKFGRAQVKWYDSVEQVIPVLVAHFARQEGSLQPEDINEEVAIALDEMVRNRHDFAEFGIFGSFIYSGEEE